MNEDSWNLLPVLIESVLARCHLPNFRAEFCGRIRGLQALEIQPHETASAIEELTGLEASITTLLQLELESTLARHLVCQLRQLQHDSTAADTDGEGLGNSRVIPSAIACLTLRGSQIRWLTRGNPIDDAGRKLRSQSRNVSLSLQELKTALSFTAYIVAAREQCLILQLTVHLLSCPTAGGTDAHITTD